LPKIVLIGAGSHVFSKNTIGDILSYPELADSTISLMDITQEPLDLITAYAKTLVQQHKLPTRIESTTDRRKALAGADYVFNTITVGPRRQIPAQSPTKFYGVELSRGDSVGAGGVFYALRQIPEILNICRDMEELCPNAWLINYSNPMAMNTWAINDYSKVKCVGLCHSVQHTAAELVRYLFGPLSPVALPEGAGPSYHQFQNQVHPEMADCDYWVAGINHMSWFLEFKWKGKDAYPLLREIFKDPAVYHSATASASGPDVVRAEIFKAFGYFVTESSNHMASYVPYFKKRPELIDKFKLDENRQAWKTRLGWDEELKQQLRSGFKFPIIRGVEYGSAIIRSIETGIPTRINANVMNKGLITNLPQGSCVEVPCLVDKEGIHPCYVGELPPQLAALNRSNINVQGLAVQGIMEKDATKLFQAVLLDPVAGMLLTIDEIRQFVDTMMKNDSEYLQGFK
jgi:alpha-galactosidase